MNIEYNPLARCELGNIVYREGRIKDDFDKVNHMFQEHRDEIDIDPYPKKVNIDLHGFAYMQAVGQCTFTGAEVDGKLVGYMGVYFFPHPFFRNVKTAMTSFFYVHPDFRKSRIGINLFKFTEAVLKEKYVVDYFSVAFNHKKDLSKYLTRLGYSPIDLIYMKKLED